MALYSTEDLIEFIKMLSGSKKVESNSDIYSEIRMGGDDFNEMIEKYATKYSVDMTNYLWYFHSDEEGQNFGGLFFKPPYCRVNRIPVTPSMLADFANKSKWDIQYPEHKLSKKRYDLIINQIIVITFLIGLLIWLFIKWLN